MPYFLEDEISLAGLEIDSLTISKDRLKANFGNGYGAAANIGSTRMHGWNLSASVLTDDSDYRDDIEGLPSFQYYEDFIDRHTGGGAEDLFVVEFRGKNYHAAFAEPKLESEMLTIDLFSANGVKLEQRRSQCALYNSDGSIFDPLSVGALNLGSWWDAQFFTVDEELADAADVDAVDWDSRNETPAVLDSGGTGSTLQTDEINGLPIIRFDGTDTWRGLGVATLNVKQLLIVAKIREATFTGNDQWFCSNGSSTALLKSSNGTTKFQDQSFGGTYTYRLNGTTYAENNQQAPMNEWGVINVRKTGGLSVGTSFYLIGDNAGNVPLVDVREVMLMEALPSEADALKLEQYLIRKHAISA